MATISRESDDRTLGLRATHSVGRARDSALQLDGPTISMRHAEFRWMGSGWTLRDLGSLNGTFVDGVRLDRSHHVLSSGASIRFGAEDESWTLLDAERPTVVATDAQGNELVAPTDLLVLPAPGDAAVSVHPRYDGSWVLECGGDARTVEDGEEVEVGSRRWRLHLPILTPSTLGGAEFVLTSVFFDFYPAHADVSVRLEVHHGEKTMDLGVRAHHEMLLALARAREHDRDRAETPESEHGWMEVGELEDALGIDEAHLNQHVFRARKVLLERGMGDASRVVERRPLRVRFGTARFRIHA